MNSIFHTDDAVLFLPPLFLPTPSPRFLALACPSCYTPRPERNESDKVRDAVKLAFYSRIKMEEPRSILPRPASPYPSHPATAPGPGQVIAALAAGAGDESAEVRLAATELLGCAAAPGDEGAVQVLPTRPLPLAEN
jgi:hypothetical protein